MLVYTENSFSNFYQKFFSVEINGSKYSKLCSNSWICEAFVLNKILIKSVKWNPDLSKEILSLGKLHKNNQNLR